MLWRNQRQFSHKETTPPIVFAAPTQEDAANFASAYEMNPYYLQIVEFVQSPVRALWRV
jgi:hypothetical protein